jgi:hypothetical protein
MKVIDFLNKMASDKEVPNKIHYGGETFYYNGAYYKCENKKFYENNRLEEFITYSTDLNKEVEIIEEDKEIEEIKDIWGSDGYLDMDSASDMVDKINELIKAVNELKKDTNN